MLRVRSAAGALPAIVSALVTAGLLTGAMVAVESAGCAEPGRYVVRPGGYELVGGCVKHGDLPVPPQQPTPAMPDPAIRN